MAGYTPGPWQVKRWTKRESGIVATIDGEDRDVCGYAYHADASLIAAAPDLLEALKLSLRPGMSGAEQLEACHAAKAAIAKAEARP